MEGGFGARQPIEPLEQHAQVERPVHVAALVGVAGGLQGTGEVTPVVQQLPDAVGTAGEPDTVRPSIPREQSRREEPTRLVDDNERPGSADFEIGAHDEQRMKGTSVGDRREESYGGNKSSRFLDKTEVTSGRKARSIGRRCFRSVGNVCLQQWR